MMLKTHPQIMMRQILLTARLVLASIAWTWEYTYGMFLERAAVLILVSDSAAVTS